MNRREREARDHAIVAARRRGVSGAKLAAQYGLTRQRVSQIVREWEDVPSIPRDGVQVDAGGEVRRVLVAFEQAIEDFGLMVGEADAPAHVRLGAATRLLVAHRDRLRLMAEAGYISRELAAPLLEQDLMAQAQAVADVLRRYDVPDEAVAELRALMARRRRGAAAVINAEAVAA